MGVRTTSPNVLCLLEIGLPCVTARVKECQKRFLTQMLNTRRTMMDDPFMAVWNLYLLSKTKADVYLQSVLDGTDIVQVDTEERKLRVSESERKKSKLYVELNPSL